MIVTVEASGMNDVDSIILYMRSWLRQSWGSCDLITSLAWMQPRVPR